MRAPGKLNLFFEVGDVQDDGYHDVASAYQAVSLYEDVWAEPADDFTVSVSGTVDVSGVPADDRNLALRAARLVAQKIGLQRRRASRHRQARPGRGRHGRRIGGCRGRARRVRRALGRRPRHGASCTSSPRGWAPTCPFALMGGTAIGTGRGDQLSPALAKGRFDWVVVPSDAGLSTPEVYAHLDALRTARPTSSPPRGRPPSTPACCRRCAPVTPIALAEHVRNDLQAAALSLRPELRDALELGEQAGALAGMVSGSGPTLAFLAGDPESALELQVVLSAAGYEALHVHGPVHGARVL